MINIMKKFARQTATQSEMLSALLYRQKSYSQEGEDRILDRFFGFREPGFYVDVGAHHPHRFSNTYLFYKRGWRGINIDAMPGSMNIFQRMRPRDINLEIGIGEKHGLAQFHIFNEKALNTFDPAIAKAHTNSNWHVQRIVDVPIAPLSSVFQKYIDKETCIDFLSIDVEGFDAEVLRSNDWNMYRPKVVLVELLRNDIENIESIEIVSFLRSNGYKFFAKTVNTFFFVREEIS
jgi:FkbM family methyltransferase